MTTEVDFPAFDVPASVPASTPSPAAAAEPSIEPAPAAAPAPETFPTDPLFAPFTSNAQQAPPPAAAAVPPAAPAAPAAPAEPQLTASELLLAQQGQLLAQIAERLNRAPAAPAAPGEPPPARDPKDIALENALVQRIPALGVLIQAMSDPQKAAAFAAILDSAPQHAQTVQSFYAGYAEQTVEALRGFYAEAYGIEPTKVTREDEDDLVDQFKLWIEHPRNAKANQRYEAGDIRVVKEFSDYFRQRFVAPAQRQGQAAVAARAATVAALPRGGGSTIPTPQQTAPTVQTPAADRDVFAEAWGELKAQRAG